MIVKDTIYVDTTRQFIIYLPTSTSEDVLDLSEQKIDPEEKEELVAEKPKSDVQDNLLVETQVEKVKVDQEEMAEMPEKSMNENSMDGLDIEEKESELNKNLESSAKDQVDPLISEVPSEKISEPSLGKNQKAIVPIETDTQGSFNRDLPMEETSTESEATPKIEEVSDTAMNEIVKPEKDYESIHKTNRILVWRLIKRFMFYSDQKYDLSTGENKSMENYRDLFQNNAVIYHDLMKSPEHVDYRDYFDDVSEYFDNVKIEQEFEDVWMIYNRLFQSDLSALETESNYSDDDESSFYYELPITKYVSNKIGNDGKIIHLEKPEEYNLRFKILVDYQQLEARIAGIYLN